MPKAHSNTAYPTHRLPLPYPSTFRPSIRPPQYTIWAARIIARRSPALQFHRYQQHGSRKSGHLLLPFWYLPLYYWVTRLPSRCTFYPAPNQSETFIEKNPLLSVRKKPGDKVPGNEGRSLLDECVPRKVGHLEYRHVNDWYFTLVVWR